MSEKNESIKRYTPEELRKLREAGNTGTNWGYLQSMSQSEADKIAATDDVNFSNDSFWNNVIFADSSKKLVGMALDNDVISFYKNLGDDCQATINSVLKAYMLVQEHRV